MIKLILILLISCSYTFAQDNSISSEDKKALNAFVDEQATKIVKELIKEKNLELDIFNPSMIVITFNAQAWSRLENKKDIVIMISLYIKNEYKKKHKKLPDMIYIFDSNEKIIAYYYYNGGGVKIE